MVGGLPLCWISALAYMELSNRIVVASLDRTITFYDTVTFDPVSRIRFVSSFHTSSLPIFQQ